MTASPYEILERVRHSKPVIHHLTNWVTIYDCAQVVKTLGAAPVMAHAPEEVVEMTRIASALVLNIGTLTNELVEAMKTAVDGARQRGIPVILDICGVGATRLRDQKSLELLATTGISIIKGNASEVARLAGAPVRTRGVDSGEVNADLLELAQELAIQNRAAVVVTGETDLITDGRRTFKVANGHPMMTKVVGTGCMAASVIGCFAAVEKDCVLAAVCGLACYEIAAECAAETAAGPASFKVRLFDCLFELDEAVLKQRARITEG